MVIWGTLLQRRVPDHLRGRISSLDFFVSLLLMPVSMALAGPASAVLGVPAVFVVAGVGPALVCFAGDLVRPDALRRAREPARRRTGTGGRLTASDLAVR